MTKSYKDGYKDPDYHHKYYLKNKKKINLASKRWAKKNKLRKLEPTEEEIDWCYRACCIYVSKQNKVRAFGHMTAEDVWGDGYEGLLIALNNFKPKLIEKTSYTKKSYIYQKVQFHLIDCYRGEYGRHGKKKLIFPNIVSINEISTNPHNDNDILEYGGMVANEIQIDNVEDTMDANYFREIIKNLFETYDYGNHKIDGNMMYQMWVNKYIDGITQETISVKFGYSQSRASQFFRDYIDPAFKVIQEQIRNDNPSWRF